MFVNTITYEIVQFICLILHSCLETELKNAKRYYNEPSSVKSIIRCRSMVVNGRSMVGRWSVDGQLVDGRLVDGWLVNGWSMVS